MCMTLDTNIVGHKAEVAGLHQHAFAPSTLELRSGRLADAVVWPPTDAGRKTAPQDDGTRACQYIKYRD